MNENEENFNMFSGLFKLITLGLAVMSVVLLIMYLGLRGDIKELQQGDGVEEIPAEVEIEELTETTETEETAEAEIAEEESEESLTDVIEWDDIGKGLSSLGDLDIRAAGSVNIADLTGYFVSYTVEGALVELGATSHGLASTYLRLDTSNGPLKGNLSFSDTYVINAGGIGGKGYNALANSSQVPTKLAISSDNDLLIGGDMEVLGTIYGSVSGTITPGFAQGSIVFANASGNLAEDNANFFWDDSTNRLGIGTASPAFPFHIQAIGSGSLFTMIENGDSTARTLFLVRNDSGKNLALSAYGSTSVSTVFGIAAADSVFYSAGGNPDNLFIGSTYNATPIIFGQGTNPERFRIDSSGNFNVGSGKFFVEVATGYVGIGTTAPGSKLDISGPDGEATSIHIHSFAKNTGFNAYRANGTQASPSALLATHPIFQMGARGYGATGYSSLDRAQIGFIASEDWTDTAQGTYIIFSTVLDGTITRSEKMRIDNAGNVGIGTTTPQSKLDIEGGAAIGASYSGTSVAPTNGLIVEGSVGIGTPSPGAKLHVKSVASADSLIIIDTTTADAAGSDAYLSFQEAGIEKWKIRSQGDNNDRLRIGSVGNANAMTMLQDGKVGIGTNAPDVKLLVQDESNVFFALTNNNSGANMTAGGQIGDLEFRPRYNGTITSEVARIKSNYQGDGTTRFGSIAFDTSNGGSPSTRMKIDYDGDVSIGNFAADVKLDVDGDIEGDLVTNSDGSGNVCYTSGGAAGGIYLLTRCVSSSARYKENIVDLTFGLDAIEALRPVEFDYQDWYSNDPRDVGFIAEEVEQVSPLLVRYNSEGQVENVKYEKLTALLVKAIQEQQEQITALQLGGQIASGSLKLDTLEVTNEAIFNGIVTAYSDMIVRGIFTAEGGIEFADGTRQESRAPKYHGDLAGAPDNSIAGDTYKNIAEDKIYFFDGSAWTALN